MVSIKGGGEGGYEGGVGSRREGGCEGDVRSVWM